MATSISQETLAIGNAAGHAGTASPPLCDPASSPCEAGKRVAEVRHDAARPPIATGVGRAARTCILVRTIRTRFTGANTA
eukprot:6202053-Pleurochrysis_carterae.AAC.2